MFLKKPLNKELKYYRSIDTCPWWNFSQATMKNDNRYLLILDYYDVLPNIKAEPELLNELNIQYFEASDSMKSKNYVNDLKYLVQLRKNYSIISDALFCLCYKFDEELIKIVNEKIRKFNHAFIFNYSNDAEYLQGIEETKRQSEQLLSRLQIKSDEFANKYKQKKSEKFDGNEIINRLFAYYKTPINQKIVTVAEVISMSKSMALEIKQQKRHGKH